MSAFYRTIYRENLQNVITSSISSSNHEEVLVTEETIIRNKDTTIPLFAVIFSPCLQSRMKSSSIAEASTILPPLRLLVSSGNGLIHAYTLIEKSNWKPSDSLTISTTTPSSSFSSSSVSSTTTHSSAVQLIPTHVYLPEQKSIYPMVSSSSTNISKNEDNDMSMISLGSKCIDVIRNYTGEDIHAGGEVLASLRLDGKVSIYIREEQAFYQQDISSSISIVRPNFEFYVENAVGTTMALIPPKQCGYSKDGVCVLVGCLDGSVTMVSTGIAIPTIVKSEKNSSSSSHSINSFVECGKVIDTVGEGNSIPTALALHPHLPYTFAVGRKDGILDLFSTVIVEDLTSYYHSYGHFRRVHRLTHPASNPIRALAYTPDGCLLIAGNDAGTIFIFDTSSPKQRTIRLVGSIFHAHKGFILSITTLSDSKRFVTSSVDKTVKVWDVASPYSGPLHTFDAGHVDMIWGVASSLDGRRCVSCGDDGLLQVYACE